MHYRTLVRRRPRMSLPPPHPPPPPPLELTALAAAVAAAGPYLPPPPHHLHLPPTQHYQQYHHQQYHQQYQQYPQYQQQYLATHSHWPPLLAAPGPDSSGSASSGPASGTVTPAHPSAIAAFHAIMSGMAPAPANGLVSMQHQYGLHQHQQHQHQQVGPPPLSVPTPPSTASRPMPQQLHTENGAPQHHSQLQYQHQLVGELSQVTASIMSHHAQILTLASASQSMVVRVSSLVAALQGTLPSATPLSFSFSSATSSMTAPSSHAAAMGTTPGCGGEMSVGVPSPPEVVLSPPQRPQQPPPLSQHDQQQQTGFPPSTFRLAPPAESHPSSRARTPLLAPLALSSSSSSSATHSPNATPFDSPPRPPVAEHPPAPAVQHEYEVPEEEEEEVEAMELSPAPSTDLDGIPSRQALPQPTLVPEMSAGSPTPQPQPHSTQPVASTIAIAPDLNAELPPFKDEPAPAGRPKVRRDDRRDPPAGRGRSRSVNRRRSRSGTRRSSWSRSRSPRSRRRTSRTRVRDYDVDGRESEQSLRRQDKLFRDRDLRGRSRSRNRNGSRNGSGNRSNSRSSQPGDQRSRDRPYLDRLGGGDNARTPGSAAAGSVPDHHAATASETGRGGGAVRPNSVRRFTPPIPERNRPPALPTSSPAPSPPPPTMPCHSPAPPAKRTGASGKLPPRPPSRVPSSSHPRGGNAGSTRQKSPVRHHPDATATSSSTARVPVAVVGSTTSGATTRVPSASSTPDVAPAAAATTAPAVVVAPAAHSIPEWRPRPPPPRLSVAPANPFFSLVSSDFEPADPDRSDNRSDPTSLLEMYGHMIDDAEEDDAVMTLSEDEDHDPIVVVHRAAASEPWISVSTEQGTAVVDAPTSGPAHMQDGAIGCGKMMAPAALSAEAKKQLLGKRLKNKWAQYV
ncbi:hypothetical protein BC828DRAFT_375425 [Blastocladiella britannica]|nr:hypothetical protein BC828DRAFT_375425 [Blastocladiella britannica]